MIADALALLKERSCDAPKVALSQTAAKIGGGFILRSGDVECDCSIKTLVASSRGATEADAAKVLFQ